MAIESGKKDASYQNMDQKGKQPAIQNKDLNQKPEGQKGATPGKYNKADTLNKPGAKKERL